MLVWFRTIGAGSCAPRMFYCRFCAYLVLVRHKYVYLACQIAVFSPFINQDLPVVVAQFLVYTSIFCLHSVHDVVLFPIYIHIYIYICTCRSLSLSLSLSLLYVHRRKNLCICFSSNDAYIQIWRNKCGIAHRSDTNMILTHKLSKMSDIETMWLINSPECNL